MLAQCSRFVDAAAVVLQSRTTVPQCSSFFDPEQRIDRLVLYGDAGVLLGYGSLQGIVDTVATPLAGDSAIPVASASIQGTILALLWVGFTLALKGYRVAATRTLPTSDALIPLAVAWLGSCAVLFASVSALGLPLDAEAEFLVGAGCVVGGWRALYAQGLPPP